MTWLHELAYFFAGVVLANAIPHYVSGVMGRPFQTPFATPPGKGLSSSAVNVARGCFNLLVAYLLVYRVGEFDARSWPDIASLGAGLLLMGIWMARNFGQFHGGNEH